MKKFLLVMFNEYKRHVLRWRFLISLFSLPLIMAILSLVFLLSMLPELNFQPVGYVDRAGLLSNSSDPSSASAGQNPSTINWIKLIAFPSEAEAASALQAGQIQAYYVLEADYLTTSRTRLVSRKRPTSLVRQTFESFVRTHLLAKQPEQIARRANSPNRLIVRSADGNQQMGLENLPTLFIPGLASLFLMLITFASSGYLMQAIDEERANFTLEILITCISPAQLIGGKTLGLIAVNLTQVLFWVTPILVPLAASTGKPNDVFNLNLSTASLGLVLVTCLLAFTIQAALMVAIGALTGDHREAQLLSGLLGLPIYIPLFTFTEIINHPHGPLAVGLSYFPLTAPIALNLRAAVAAIPPQQLAQCIGIQVLCAALSIWMAGKAWRWGMLQTGRSISLRALLHRAPKPEQPA